VSVKAVLPNPLEEMEDEFAHGIPGPPAFSLTNSVAKDRGGEADGGVRINPTGEKFWRDGCPFGGNFPPKREERDANAEPLCQGVLEGITHDRRFSSWPWHINEDDIQTIANLWNITRQLKLIRFNSINHVRRNYPTMRNPSRCAGS
jgi:hypothetical protein